MVLKRIRIAALPIMLLLMFTACSYANSFELRDNVVGIELIHYDNPGVGFARNFLGFALGRGRYQNFDSSLAQTLEHLNAAQAESFLAAIDGESFFEHVAGRPNAPDGLAVIIRYASGEFDVLSSSFSALYNADGSFDSYVAAWWGIEDIIHRYFQTDISWFLGRTPPTVDEFTRLMQREGLTVITIDVEDIPGTRRRARAYFRDTNSGDGFIEFTEFWGHVRAREGFEAQRETMLNNIGSNHTIREEQIANHMMLHIYSRGNIYRTQRASDVTVSVHSVSQAHSEWIEDIFERLFPKRSIEN